jgi:hypothetical protein
MLFMHCSALDRRHRRHHYQARQTNVADCCKIESNAPRHSQVMSSSYPTGKKPWQTGDEENARLQLTNKRMHAAIRAIEVALATQKRVK